MSKHTYTWSGTGLLACAILTGLSAYFIFNSVWLASLGICLFILAVILITLGNSVPRLPPEACSLLFETGVNNVTALLDELGVRSKAVFLPSSLARKQPRAFIPLDSGGPHQKISRVLPRRLITRYGNNPEDVGILVPTIGGAAVTILESKPGASFTELETALNSLLAGSLGLADGTRVSGIDKHITVEIIKPRPGNGVTRSDRYLGSPMAMIVASVAAEAWDAPVTIGHEEQGKGNHRVELEIVK